MQLIFIMGPTNVGKTTFMSYAREQGEHVVEVGKMLRAKYPPSYFEGQAAPAKTATEAWQLMLDGIATAEAAGARRVLIDGQPRDMEQARKSLLLPFERKYCLLWVPAALREQRAHARDGHDPEKLDLSLRRLQTDLLTGYDVMCYVASQADLQVVDVSEMSVEQVYQHVVV